MKVWQTILVGLWLATIVRGYLPGVAPVDYVEDENVELKVNKLTSIKTQLPYDYYVGLPFCRPETIVDKKQNLGEIMRGDRIKNSLFKINFLKNSPCEVLGQGLKISPFHDGMPAPINCSRSYNREELAKFSQFIRNQYRIHWILDNMPAAQPIITAADPTHSQGYSIGFALGYRDEAGSYFLNNHYSITIRYRKETAAAEGRKATYRVVGFEVVPRSIAYKAGAKPECRTAGTAPLKVGPGLESLPHMAWTYSVEWAEDSSVVWADRWERYYANSDAQIHWFAIVNSIMIVLFLTGMVAMIMMRTLHADLRQYSQRIESGAEDVEETGWKLVHGDVFRPPRNPALFSVLVGFGSQIFVSVIVLLFFAVLGFMSPAYRGGLLTAMLVLIFLAGIFSGYNSTKLYKMFKGTHWKRNTLMTAFLVPGTIFVIFIFLNFFIWGEHSSGGVTFLSLLTLAGLWFGLSIPLTFVGSYIAFKRPAKESPVGTNQIPRQIPEQVWYMSPTLSVLMGGILPFGAVFIELYFILSAVWGQQLYYIFGFLFIVFLILVITCAEISIVMTYFQLCSEDYHWWWRSYLTSGSSALYFFLYSIFYFATKLEITNFVSGLLYFGYTLIFSIVFFVLTGFIGYQSAYLFVHKIYSSIPFD